jgi:hypothetical protein
LIPFTAQSDDARDEHLNNKHIFDKPMKRNFITPKTDTFLCCCGADRAAMMTRQDTQHAIFRASRHDTTLLRCHLTAISDSNEMDSRSFRRFVRFHARIDAPLQSRNDSRLRKSNTRAKQER